MHEGKRDGRGNIVDLLERCVASDLSKEILEIDPDCRIEWRVCETLSLEKSGIGCNEHLLRIFTLILSIRGIWGMENSN